jgi:anti-anti-sigma factor
MIEGIEISPSRVGARGDIALLTVRGYVDTMTCSGLLKKISHELNNGLLHIVVNMSQVNYVSSAGWGVFVGEIKGIRERGGDLVIVEMIPEVYDVFEMLEFHRILPYYECIEEAVNDFDYSIGVDITKSLKKNVSLFDTQTETIAKRTVVRADEPQKQRFVFEKTKIDKKLLPLTEKIKLAIIEDPTRGPLKLRQALNTSHFGYTKINIFRMLGILRKLNLNNKQKRYRFYRSR